MLPWLLLDTKNRQKWAKTAKKALFLPEGQKKPRPRAVSSSYIYTCQYAQPIYQINFETPLLAVFFNRLCAKMLLRTQISTLCID